MTGERDDQAGATPFGALIEDYRRERGLLQRELAARLGVTQGQLSEWKTGKRPPVRAVVRFAHLAGLDLARTLAAAGLWPADVPLPQPGAAPAPAAVDACAEACRRLLAARPELAAGDAVRLLELWALLPSPQQEALFAAVRELATRAQRAR